MPGITYTTTEATCDGVTTTLYQADYMTRGNQHNTFRRWHPCTICGEEYPETEIQDYEGAKYGIPCGCYKDIHQLRKDKTIKHHREVRGREHR